MKATHTNPTCPTCGYDLAGIVREDEVRRALNFEPAALGAHLSVLRREGYVRKVDDRVQVAYEEDDAEEDDPRRFLYHKRIRRPGRIAVVIPGGQQNSWVAYTRVRPSTCSM